MFCKAHFPQVSKCKWLEVFSMLPLIIFSKISSTLYFYMKMPIRRWKKSSEFLGGRKLMVRWSHKNCPVRWQCLTVVVGQTGVMHLRKQNVMSLRSEGLLSRCGHSSFGIQDTIMMRVPNSWQSTRKYE